MKREGRQHGMVRSYRILPSPLNPRPNTRFVNNFDSPPTAGLFTKVSYKPTSHSKFTGKCGTARCTACHLHPACKSRDKTKGTQKLKSDVVSNVRPGFNLSGFSATAMLDHLENEVGVEEEGDEEVDYPGSVNHSYSFADLFHSGDEPEIRTLRWNGCDDDENGICEDDWVSYEYSEMEHYQVEDDEDWCLVESG